MRRPQFTDAELTYDNLNDTDYDSPYTKHSIDTARSTLHNNDHDEQIASVPAMSPAVRRPPFLTVDTDFVPAKVGLSATKYELSQSPSIKPKHSIDTVRSTLHDDEKREEPAPASPNEPAYNPPAPTIRLLFSLVSRRDLFVLLLPAIATSIVSGGVAPFMTYVIGQVFDAFAQFPLTNPSQQDKYRLRHDVGIAAIELLALAAGAIALGSITSALWIAVGERNVMRLRKKVYAAVTEREMEWFDTKMGADDSAVVASESDGPVGAGGLMAKFARDTDDVRMASSLASGMLVQYLTTCITCLVLAFARSWALTLVILSAVPALVLIQGFSQRFAGPLVQAERQHTGVAATRAERALGAIATVKAFNAQTFESEALSRVLDALDAATTKANGVWGASSALAQFASMGMFVQGFWFGARLVRNGDVSPGDVMAVFWACLIAASNLQLCIPQLITLAKGKFAMSALVALIEPPPLPAPTAGPRTSSASSTHSHLTITPVSSEKTNMKRPLPQLLRKIQPMRCTGELALHGVTFAYPSRPAAPVLRDVSLFFPAGELTFVVGGSGSGKSTVAQLLARLYCPAAGAGSITVDEQDAAYVDERWLRSHVAVVSQACILFDGSVFENVALGVAGAPAGRAPADVTRAEVERACTIALMHDFIRDLPAGYDTPLGTGGASLSGGQKQRLAIARAILRDPTVLVLDEATSALDATSRVLVFEAIKAQRKNKTTVVITHDLSQITQGDFVYVLRDGRVVEQGYRADLEVPPEGGEAEGELRKMMHAQDGAGGFQPRRDSQIRETEVPDIDIPEILEAAHDGQDDLEESSGSNLKRMTMRAAKHQSVGVGLSGWMFDVVHDLARSRAPTPSLLPPPVTKSTAPSSTKHFSMNPAVTSTLSRRVSRRTSFDVRASRVGVKKRLSLQFTPTSPTMPQPARLPSPTIEDDDEFELEKSAIERSGAEATKRRVQRGRAERTRWTEISLDTVITSPPTAEPEPHNPEPEQSFFQLLRTVYPTVPRKPFLFLGLVICLLSGAMTPIFSFLLSRLLFEVSIGAQNVTTINIYGGVVLAVAATDGLLMGLKFFVMEAGAMAWVTSLRKACYARLLAQDKAFFDRRENAAIRLVQVLIKDGDDARNLIAVVIGQFVVVAAMLGVGLVWALVSGWELTLAGLAIGPVFAVTMAVQANLVARCERKNKLAREEIAKGYYECISNIRAIRCMSFEGVFKQQFDDAVTRGYATGVKGAFVEGCTFGVANGLIYLAEALLFFVGAVLVAQGTYTYLQMVQVLNLVVFTVTIGSQLMAFTQRIAKATQATRDFFKILMLSADTDESCGSATPLIEGDIEFSDVSFSYPERADVPVLQKASLKLRENECVAVVGASGSGKSTVAALLQRLYEPSSGSITIGSSELRMIDVNHLRAHVSVVSQSPNLFDASVAENIAYGNPTLSRADIERAAQAAHVHDFVASLPRGYDTPVGESAALISGGQAQRLAIARALARPARVLVLDECTSALDPANQAAVMDSIRAARIGRTTLIITHKLPVMQMCDRILVVHEGVVAEEGTYQELVRRNGIFSQLASGGEWSGE